MAGVWQISRDAPSSPCDPGAMSDRTAYLAAEGYVDELAYELGAVDREHGRLLIAEGPPMCGSIRTRSRSPRYRTQRHNCARSSATGRSTPPSSTGGRP